MSTPTPPTSDARQIAALLDEIDSEQARLRRILAGRDAAALAARPVSGRWSVLENVRHLIFAEQLHLGRFVTGGRNWSPFGYTPERMRSVRKMVDDGSADPSVEDVLTAWVGIHATIASGLVGRESEDLREALVKNLKHLRAHILVVERLRRPSSGANSTG